jgi:hypothetical protein
VGNSGVNKQKPGYVFERAVFGVFVCARTRCVVDGPGGKREAGWCVWVNKWAEEGRRKGTKACGGMIE